MAFFNEISGSLLFYFRNGIQIFILAVLIYYILYYLRGTKGANILSGIVIVLILLTTLADRLDFGVISMLLNNLWAIIPIAFIVIFHPELRRAFAQLGTTPFISKKLRKQEALNEVVQALTSMSRQKTGALIVFERRIGMRSIVNSSIRIEGRLTRHLLESIFYPNSPLHDGAVIVKDENIIAAHAILPLSQDESLVKTLGTRHRAAIGITEETDAVAAVVSEETGIISIACKGRIRRDIKHEKLTRFLGGLLLTGEDDTSLQSIFGTLDENDKLSDTLKGD